MRRTRGQTWNAGERAMTREKERESETLDARKVANLGESCENFSCDKFARAAR